MRALRVGTRGSLLARRQTAWVIGRIREKYADIEIEERVIATRGDLQSATPLSKLPQIGEKGLFTRELEGALISGEIDLAVHSLKDLPTELPDGVVLGAVPERANPLDALVSRGRGDLASLPAGMRVGTSSLRRAAQIRRLYPELEIADIRGNLDTRLRKLSQERVDALILAAAGLERMGWQPHAYSLIPPETCLPAPGQGALAVEIREDDPFMRELCGAALEDPSARLAVTAERAFLTGLGGGCQAPVGALALVRGDLLRLQGIVIQVNGRKWLSDAADARPEEAFEAGVTLANRLLEQGAGEILAAACDE